MTYAALKKAVKAVVFPIGEPENLVPIHDAFITDGLNTIQQYVKCHRDNNVSVVSFSDTLYSCGLTVTEMPDGFIKRVYTLPNTVPTGTSDTCCRVYLKKATRAYLNWLEREHEIDFGERARPDQTGQPVEQLNDLVPGAASDSKLGRALDGFWALEGCRMYVWPHLQSTEDLVIEWTGIKNSYADPDIVFDDSPKLQRALRLYLQREVARDLDCDDDKLQKFTTDFEGALADLYWACRQKLEGTYAEEDTLPVLTNDCTNNGLNGTLPGGFTLPGTVPGAPVTPVVKPWLYRFAVIGNYGLDNASTAAVAALVNSWTPSMVTTTGANVIGGDGSILTLDSAVGRNYHSYIFPYTGIYGPGASDRNKFWPTFSVSEVASPARENFFSFLPIPKTNGGFYYDHIEGPVHLFFIDSTGATPDGNTSTSVQADWLRVKLATSPCKFKLVYIYDTPYNSFGAENITMRWPFKAWGATAVLSGAGPFYQRLQADSIPFMVVGDGGALGLHSFGFSSSSPFNITYWATTYGAVLVTVNCDSLKFEFYALDGTIKDTLLINSTTVQGAPMQ